MKVRRKALLLACSIAVMGAVTLAALLWHGVIWFNNPDDQEFPVRGIDVSHHQGIIDWKTVAAAGIRFAYIKATEGGDFKDNRFLRNWTEARSASIARGAYHFFTLCSPGADQAANFIATVPREADALPPVVDLELGGNCSARPPAEVFRQELREFQQLVESHFAKRMVFYVTYEFLEHYFYDNNHVDGTVWIRDVFSRPRLRGGIEWDVWQYNSRGRVPGIAGPVDLNAFHGGANEFRTWRAGSLCDRDRPASSSTPAKKSAFGSGVSRGGGPLFSPNLR